MESGNCGLCGESGVNLYYCENCPAESDECTNEVHREHLCDSCITHHVKRGHDVKTVKGQVPLICDTHKMLHSLYCKTCDVTYCSKCSKIHSKHELGDIEERASELKKEVFEILTEFELGEKPLRAKKESIIEQEVCIESEQNELKKCIVKEIEELKDSIVKVIDENCGLFSEHKSKVDNEIDICVDLQQQARNLLSLENCCLIQKFKNLDDSASKYRKQSESILCEQLTHSSCNVTDIKGKFSDFKKEAVLEVTSILKTCEKNSVNDPREMNFATVKSKDIQHYSSDYICFPVMQAYRLIIEENQLKVQKVVAEEGCVKCVEEMACFIFDRNVEAIYFKSSMSKVIVQTHEGFSVVYVDNNGYKIDHANFQPMNGFICPYVHNNKLHQCHYDANEKVIRFTHDTDIFFNCSHTPKLISYQYYPFVCLVTDNNDVLTCKLYEKEFYSIPFEVHKVSSVDYVQFYYSRFRFLRIANLFIWSVKKKSITILLLENKLWKLDQIIYWSDPVQIMTTQLSYPSRTVHFLPAVKKRNSAQETTDVDLRYVYAVLDTAETQKIK